MRHFPYITLVLVNRKATTSCLVNQTNVQENISIFQEKPIQRSTTMVHCFFYKNILTKSSSYLQFSWEDPEFLLGYRTIKFCNLN